MDTLLQQLNAILVEPPGNLIVHLTLAFSIFAALQAALITRRGGLHARALLGLNLLLLAQLALFIASGLAWQGVIAARLVIPPLERAVVVFSLLWIGWMWAFPEPSASRMVNTVSTVVLGLFNLGILLLLLFTFNQWSKESTALAFNNTWLDWIWSFSGVAIVVLSLITVVLRRPEGWAIGVGMALVNLAGLLAQIFLSPPAGDAPSLIRLAQLASYPLLPGLMARQNRSAGTSAPQSTPAPSETPTTSKSPRLTDPRSIHAWLDLNVQSEPARICTGLARAVAQSLLADLCYVATSPNGERSPVILQGGYDLIREDEVPGTIIDQSRVPTLVTHLIKARAVRILTGDNKPADLKNLADILGFKDIGSLLLIPLTHKNKPWGGLLLLSPYSNRQWTPDEMNYLAAESDLITEVLIRAQHRSDSHLEIEQANEKLADLTQEAEMLRQQNQQLLADIAHLRQSAATAVNPASPDIEALLAVQQETQETLSLVQSENARLKALLARSAGASGGGEYAQMENELRTVLQEVARLQNQLIQSNSRVLELEHRLQDSPDETTHQWEAVNALIQEIRQPMSSIMGYTDLLLAESLGILGKGQRNFVERIRNSAERLRNLIDDIVNLTSTAQSPEEPSQIPVEISEIIDQAVAEISPQLFQRSIQLHIDLPEQLPALRSDRDSLQQIVGHLLQNAGAATPDEGTIGLRGRLWHEENNEFIILQVTDSGGGISNEDLPRVFARHYGADKTVLPGTGDNGVGLALAKTLTLAVGGRIWVESVPGRTTTFTVLLPTRPGQPQPAASAEVPAA